MHDLNLTAMFSDQVALISDGVIIAQDAPEHVLTDDHLSHAYHCHLRVNAIPPAGTYLLPHLAQLAS
jgi:iron complex transport system ATP-binding protein